MSTRATASGLAALLGLAGAAHLRYPRPFDTLVPEQLPGSPRAWTVGSGLAELAVAALLAVPATRRVGGRAATLLFLLVWPGNVKMAWDWRHRPAPQRAVALGRLPLQVPLVLWARQVARGTDRRR